MLNNIKSTTVGLNQNLGKLQELGNVKNDQVVPDKAVPSAVWGDYYNENKDMAQWEVGDRVLKRDGHYKVKGWDEYGKPILERVSAIGWREDVEANRGHIKK